MRPSRFVRGFSRNSFAPLRTLDEIRLVAAWDMTRQARRPSFFLMRSALAGFIVFQVLVLWWGQIEERQWFSESQNSAVIPISQLVFAIERMFSGTVLMMALGLILFCPALTSGTIAGDRERKIWHDLANSPLSGWSILMGKMVARLATVFSWILVAMPLWGLLSLIGGLDPLAITLIMLGLFFYGWMYAALGLLASVATKRSRDALGLVTSFVCILIFLPLFVVEFARGFGFRTTELQYVAEHALLFNPAWTLPEIPRWIAQPRGSLLRNAWISLPSFFLIIALSGPVLTLLAGALLRPLGRRLDSGGTGERAPLTSGGTRRSKPARRRLPDFSEVWPVRILFEPMMTKERRVRSGSRLTRNLRRVALGIYFGVTLALLASQMGDALREFLSYGYYGGNTSQRNEVMGICFVVSGFTAAMLQYGLMLDAAGRIVMEKEQDSWTTLLSTPLESREILKGKAFGAFWSWRWAFVHLGIFWAVAMAVGAMNPIGLMVACFIWTIQLIFFTLMGLRIGMNSGSHATVVSKCIGAYLILQIGIPMIVAWLFQGGEATFSQPAILAAFCLDAGNRSKGFISFQNEIAFGVFWQFIMAFVSALLVIELLSTFDRKTGRD